MSDHKVEIECNKEALDSMLGLLRRIWWLTSVGSTRSISVDDFETFEIGRTISTLSALTDRRYDRLERTK